MKVLLFAAAAVISLSACQGTPVGDAMIGKEKLAQMDDEYCRSIGAKPGSTPYMQCRMFKTDQRERNHRSAYQRAAAGFAGAGQSYGNAMQQNANRRVTCNSNTYGTTTTTNCY